MRRSVLVSTAFYLGLIAITVAIQLQILPQLLPDPVALRIGHNSEGYVLALLFAAWIQHVRPRLLDSPRQWPVTTVAVVGCLAVAIHLFLSDYPSRVKTLNETFFALALILPVIQRRRSLSPLVAVVLSLCIFAVIAASARTPLGTDLAETLGALLLFPIGFYVVDRGILDPSAPTSVQVRRIWYATLVLLPIVMSILQYQIGFSGLADGITRYIVRFHEAFVFLLLIEVFFAVGLGRRGQRPVPSRHPAGTTPLDVPLEQRTISAS